MHELSIMERALNLALAQARQAGATRVYIIRLRVGAVSGVTAEALRFAFTALAKGTAAEGAELVIENVAVQFWCPTCQGEFVPADFLGSCTTCGHLRCELRSGRELEVASLEVD